MQQTMISRRKFLGLAAGLAMAGVGAAGYAAGIEPAWLSVERVDLPLPRLAGALAGKTVALLTDIHISQFTPAAKLLSVVESVNALTPDWVCITGDFICSGSDQAGDLIEPLRKLESPAFAVLGNHDLHGRGMTVVESLAETPVTLLRNHSIPLDASLWLSGLDDTWYGRPNLKRTLADVPPQTATLLMAHEPDYFDQVIAADAPVAVQFSGHTHGGQVRLPRLTPDEQGNMTWAPVLPRFGQRYSMGLYQVDERYVYTNRGIGAWPLPYRVNCRPEITLFTLHQA